MTFADSAMAEYPDAVQALNPIAYWRFNDATSAEGDTAADSSASGTHSGIYHNGVTLITSSGPISLPGPGSGGGAASFDGDNDYIGNISETGFPAGNADRTFIAWLKYPPPTEYGHGTLIHYGTNTYTNAIGIGVYNANDSHTPNNAVGVSQYGDSVGFDPIVDGEWHFYAVTVENSNYRLYFDGDFLREKVMTTNTVLSPEATISEPGEMLLGTLDEMALFGTALSDQDIQGLYQEMFIPEPATLGLLLIGGLTLISRRRK